MSTSLKTREAVRAAALEVMPILAKAFDDDICAIEQVQERDGVKVVYCRDMEHDRGYEVWIRDGEIFSQIVYDDEPRTSSNVTGR